MDAIRKARDAAQVATVGGVEYVTLPKHLFDAALAAPAEILSLVPGEQSARNPLGTVDRKPVAMQEHIGADTILRNWNALTGQALTSKDWLAKIIMRIREHPELGYQDHVEVIRAALAAPWWSGHPSPSVIYGNGAVFEQALTLARNGPAPPKPANGTMRYGRGMTTAQILEATRDLR